MRDFEEGTSVLPVKGGSVIVQISLLMRAYHQLISFFLLAYLYHSTGPGLQYLLKEKHNLTAVKKGFILLFSLEDHKTKILLHVL